MNAMSTPRVVQLHFVKAQLNVEGETPLCVEIRDPNDRSVIAIKSLGQTAEWLKTFGFEYMTGTAAVWVRA